MVESVIPENGRITACVFSSRMCSCCSFVLGHQGFLNLSLGEMLGQVWAIITSNCGRVTNVVFGNGRATA